MPSSLERAPIQARGIRMRVALRGMLRPAERVPPRALPIAREEEVKRQNGRLGVDVVAGVALQGSAHRRMQSPPFAVGQPLVGHLADCRALEAHVSVRVERKNARQSRPGLDSRRAHCLRKNIANASRVEAHPEAPTHDAPACGPRGRAGRFAPSLRHRCSRAARSRPPARRRAGPSGTPGSRPTCRQPARACGAARHGPPESIRQAAACPRARAARVRDGLRRRGRVPRTRPRYRGASRERATAPPAGHRTARRAAPPKPRPSGARAQCAPASAGRAPARGTRAPPRAGRACALRATARRPPGC